MDTISDDALQVTLGVDTHLDLHVGALLDGVGRTVATMTVPATQAGYRQLLGWARQHGHLCRAGVEGSGSYGAGLARFLAAEGIEVIEVTRASRVDRRHVGKNDVIDAQAAARAVLAGAATARPKLRDGIVESIRVLRLARQTAVKAHPDRHPASDADRQRTRRAARRADRAEDQAIDRSVRGAATRFGS